MDSREFDPKHSCPINDCHVWIETITREVMDVDDADDDTCTLYCRKDYVPSTEQYVVHTCGKKQKLDDLPWEVQID